MAVQSVNTPSAARQYAPLDDGAGGDAPGVGGKKTAAASLTPEQLLALAASSGGVGGDGANVTGAPQLQAPAASGKSDAQGAAQALAALNAGTASVDIFAIMAAFQKSAQEMRSSARQTRQSELEGQVADLKSAAQEIRNAAQDRFSAAVVQGSMQIAGGALSLGMAGAGALKSLKGANMEAQAGAFKTEADGLETQAGALKAQADDIENQPGAPIVEAEGMDNDPDALRAKADGLSVQAKDLSAQADSVSAAAGKLQSQNTALKDVVKGVSGVLGSAGALASTALERNAAGHDAAKATDEATAQVHAQGVQDASDTMQQMLGVIQDIQNKLGAIEQANTDSIKGIARNI